MFTQNHPPLVLLLSLRSKVIVNCDPDLVTAESCCCSGASISKRNCRPRVAEIDGHLSVPSNIVDHGGVWSRFDARGKVCGTFRRL